MTEQVSAAGEWRGGMRPPLRKSPAAALLAAVAVAAATGAAYLPVFRADFVYDDPLLIEDDPFVTGGGSIAEIFTTEFFAGGGGASGFYRPAVVLFFRAIHGLFGLEPAAFHAAVVLAHAAGAVLLLLLLIRCGLPMAAGLVGALFFAVHPANCESVAWISAGSSPLSFLGGALSLYLLLEFRDQRGPSWKRPELWLSLAAFLASLLARETALVFALLAFLVIASRDSRDQPGTSGKLVFFIPFAGAVALYLVLRVNATGGGTAPEFFVGRGSPAERVLTFLGLVPRYLGLLLWPRRLSLARPVGLESSPFALEVVTGALALAACACLLFLARRRGWRPVLFGSGLVLFGLLCASSLVPFAYNFPEMDFPFFERLLYFPAAGAGCLAAAGLAAALGRPRLRLPLLGIAAAGLVSLGARTYDRSLDWQDNLTLFTREVALFPESPTLHLNLGEAFQRCGQREASAAAEAASRSRPREAENLRGKAEQWHRKAVAAFERALALDPGNRLARITVAISLFELGETQDAVDLLRGVLQEDPDNADAMANLGAILAGQGDLEAALPLFAAVCRARNSLPADHGNLGRLLLELKTRAEDLYLEGNLDEVLVLAETVLAEAPDAPWAHEVKGLILFDRGDQQGAVAELQAAVALSSDSLLAAARLAEVYRREGLEAEALELDIYIEEGLKRLPPEAAESVKAFRSGKNTGRP